MRDELYELLPFPNSQLNFYISRNQCSLFPVMQCPPQNKNSVYDFMANSKKNIPWRTLTIFDSFLPYQPTNLQDLPLRPARCSKEMSHWVASYEIPKAIAIPITPGSKTPSMTQTTNVILWFFHCSTWRCQDSHGLHESNPPWKFS